MIQRFFVWLILVKLVINTESVISPINLLPIIPLNVSETEEAENNNTDTDKDHVLRTSRSLEALEPIHSDYSAGFPPPEPLPAVNDSDGFIDKILNVQADPTQIVVYTSKNGPFEKLRIRIELTDLQDNRPLPPIDLQGIWLMIGRGKYTIPFLKPDRWYGLYFRSENLINNRPISHSEERLVKTSSRQSNLSVPMENLFNVKMHRSLEGEENTEGFYITAKWLTPDHRINGSNLLIDVKVHCKQADSDEKIRLPFYDDSVTVEIRIDHQYQLERLNETSHQVRAHITPLSCTRICWKKHIEIVTSHNRFSQYMGEDCNELEGTTSVTYLRNLKHYTVEGDADRELVVDTESVDTTEDAFVTIQALRVDTGNASDVVYRTFNTKDSNGSFRVPLADNAVYAVQYEYTKVKPFHYTEKEHFLVETPSANSSRPTRLPVEMAYYPEQFTGHDHIANLKPEIVLSRGSNYAAHDVHVHLEPFCNAAAQDILLTSQQPAYHLNLGQLICSNYPYLEFCKVNPFVRTNDSSCTSPILCYSNSVILNTGSTTTKSETEGTGTPELYSSDIRCLNVTQHFDIPTSSSRQVVACLPLMLIMLTQLLLQNLYGSIL